MCFIDRHFEKLLLSLLFIATLAIFLHAIHAKDVDPATINWLQNTVGQILAALLALMVGTRLAQRNGDSKTSNTVTPPNNGGPSASTPTQ